MPQLRGSITRRRLMAAAAAAGLAAGTSLAAGAAMSASAAAPAHPASAAAAKFPVTSIEIDTRQTKVHTSTHKKLTFFVFISSRSSLQDSASQTTGMTVGFSPQGGRGVILAARPRGIATRSGGHSAGTRESHEWTFALRTSSLHINTKKGTGTVKSKRQLKRFGKFTLKLAPAGKAHRSCSASTGFTSTRKVTLVGTSRFNTKSGRHGWGVVGRAHRMKLKATLMVDYGIPDCGHPLSLPCSPVGILLDTSANGSDLGVSGAPGKRARISATRQVELSSPAGAVRSDLLAGTAKALKAKHDAHGNLTFGVRPRSSNAAGSATVTTSMPPGISPCRKTATDVYFGSWVNGAKKFSIRGQIEKRITIKNNPNADAQVTKRTA
jgi:hypothetical protein